MKRAGPFTPLFVLLACVPCCLPLLIPLGAGLVALTGLWLLGAAGGLLAAALVVAGAFYWRSRTGRAAARPVMVTFADEWPGRTTPEARR